MWIIGFKDSKTLSYSNYEKTSHTRYIMIYLDIAHPFAISKKISRKWQMVVFFRLPIAINQMIFGHRKKHHHRQEKLRSLSTFPVEVEPRGGYGSSLRDRERPGWPEVKKATEKGRIYMILYDIYMILYDIFMLDL